MAVKEEDIDEAECSKKPRNSNGFTREEDQHLRKGIVKYGKSNWSRILKDPEFSFAKKRSRDSLRMRAKTLGLFKKKEK